jgi:hypothetical protein
MPIFVSRFSAERIAASGLQRATQRQPESRATTQRNRVDRLDESERERAAQRSERAQDQLPVTTQTAESIRQGIQSSRAGSDQRSEDSRSGQQGNSAGQETARPTLPTQATLPGVSTVSTRAERSASPQVGRLNQARGESRAQATLSRFEGLRSASPATPGNTRSAEVSQSFRDIPSNADSFSGLRAQRLDAQVDASIRLLRSNGNASERVQQPAAEPETTSVTAQPETRPNAEQISRANTTPEIQSNLRQDYSEIKRGLRADAEIQSQGNLRQTARTAGRAAEARRESTADANARQVRELSVQERQLTQSLRATQSEIRNLNNESNQAQSSASSATLSTASNLVNRTTLIV